MIHDPPLTRRQACAYLQVSESTLERRIRAGLPVHRPPGGHPRFYASELDAWLRRHGREPAVKLSDGAVDLAQYARDVRARGRGGTNRGVGAARHAARKRSNKADS